MLEGVRSLAAQPVDAAQVRVGVSQFEQPYIVIGVLLDHCFGDIQINVEVLRCPFEVTLLHVDMADPERRLREEEFRFTVTRLGLQQQLGIGK